MYESTYPEQQVAEENGVDVALGVLEQTYKEIIELFDPNIQALAQEALFDLVATHDGTNYYAPNPNCLPYVLRIMQSKQRIEESSQVSNKLYAIKSDCRNTRLVNEATSEQTGNLVIALNLASYTHLPSKPGEPMSIAIRYKGDEILVLSTAKNEQQNNELLAQLDQKDQDNIKLLRDTYAPLKTIDCSLNRDEPQAVNGIRIEGPVDHTENPASLRPQDVVSHLYNQELIISTTQEQMTHNQSTIAALIKHAINPTYPTDPLPKEEEDILPKSSHYLLQQAQNTPLSRELVRKLTFNELYPRDPAKNEFVYLTEPYFQRVCDVIRNNPDKKYRLMMCGPLELKPANNTSHKNGDLILRGANSTQRKILGQNMICNQSRGSFIVLDEEDDKFDQQLKQLSATITTDAILMPLKHLDEPAIAYSVVDGPEWDQFMDMVRNAGTDVWTQKERDAFWSIVDKQRPVHYVNEILEVVDKLPGSIAVAKNVFERFQTKFNQIRDELLRIPLTAIDLTLLENYPEPDASTEEYITYYTRLRDLCSRLRIVDGKLIINSPRLTPLSN